MPPEGLEGISPHDPRLDPAYYAYYYSQRPLDPRLPPPIMSWQWGPNGGMMVPSVPGRLHYCFPYNFSLCFPELLCDVLCLHLLHSVLSR